MFADMPPGNRAVDQVAALRRLRGPRRAGWKHHRATRRS